MQSVLVFETFQLEQHGLRYQSLSTNTLSTCVLERPRPSNRRTWMSKFFPMQAVGLRLSPFDELVF